MKKFIIGGLAGLMMSSVAFAAGGMYFPDVKIGSWYYGAVDYVSANGLMKGYTSGNFGPDDSVTRAQLAQVLMNVDAEKIDEMYTELNAVRVSEVGKLAGKGWDAYIAARMRFPIEGVQGAAEGTITYAVVKDDLKTLAKDKRNGLELLSMSDGNYGFFFIKENSDMAGELIYGPFYDEVPLVVTEVQSK